MKTNLRKRLDEIQDRACLLDGVMEAINFIENEDGCPNGRHTLCVIAKELSAEIFDALDTTELVKFGGRHEPAR
jgi:hypothetical protein